MKKILYCLLALLFLLQTASAYAITPTTAPTKTASNSATPAGIIQEINNLKDRIASRVAQLNLVEKRGIIGTVTDIGETQLTLSDKDGNIRYVDVDELTKFSSPSAKENFGISDITKGSLVGVLGRYNRDSKRVLARFVDVLVFPQIISGAVMDIDADNYTITVITPDKKQFLVSIENLTKTYMYTKADGTVKSGFSKIQKGERIIVIGFFDKNNKNEIVGLRIFRFPEVKINPKIPSLSIGSTPSTGSGMKLVPITGTKK